ncbi:MAG: 6-phosphogluconolactonase [bacterium]
MKKIEIFQDADAVAKEGARLIAAAARSSVGEKGIFNFAVSGGKTPWVMLRELAAEELPWTQVHVFQIDERIAPEGDKDRNLTHLMESLAGSPIPPENIHAMPVNASDPEQACRTYEETLEKFTGIPATLDLAHLGLGPDGHTASLVPCDPVLKVRDLDVALTAPYQGRNRMTLTFPMINRSRAILWLATGAEKAPMIERLKHGDPTIPGGNIAQQNAILLADALACPSL